MPVYALRFGNGKIARPLSQQNYATHPGSPALGRLRRDIPSPCRTAGPRTSALGPGAPEPSPSPSAEAGFIATQRTGSVNRDMVPTVPTVLRSAVRLSSLQSPVRHVSLLHLGTLSLLLLLSGGKEAGGTVDNKSSAGEIEILGVFFLKNSWQDLPHRFSTGRRVHAVDLAHPYVHSSSLCNSFSSLSLPGYLPCLSRSTHNGE